MNATEEFAPIQELLQPLKDEIVNHPVYRVIRTMDDLKVFMKYHVYAVWDFMSLLKALQLNLTCVSIPWFPVGHGDTRALINEIVAGEESDVDLNGEKKSHFEMYLEAMEQCGADLSEIHIFIETLKSGKRLDEAYLAAGTPKAARSFVDFTFSIIAGGQSHLQAGAFTFGREDLIPKMFVTIVNDLDQKFPGQISLFKYYLDRHIEVDGEHHSHLALEMTSKLCQDQPRKWQEVEQTCLAALQQRINLWNGAYSEIMDKKYNNPHCFYSGS